MCTVRAATALAVLAAILGVWAYRALPPPPVGICGSPGGGPPATAPRVRLGDGRYLAYREWGVPREEARHRIVFVHGFDNSKDFGLNVSRGLMEALRVYIVSFDRAGYGESDPNPGRTVASEAMDIQGLADRLELGERFYVVGFSMGGYPAWSCIKHIPHRLSGAALIAPVINYWWPSLPAEPTREAFAAQQPADQWAMRIAHHAPWLLYAYLRLGSPPETIAWNDVIFSRQDKQIVEMLAAVLDTSVCKARRQGVYESLYRDAVVGFGDWGFEPMELQDPFPGGGGGGGVHIWQGAEDRMVSTELQRHVAGRLPWVRYHECADCGHMFPYLDSWGDAIVKALVAGEPSTAGPVRSSPVRINV